MSQKQREKCGAQAKCTGVAAIPLATETDGYCQMVIVVSAGRGWG